MLQPTLDGFECDSEVIQRYLVGHASPREGELLEVHLDHCQRCREELETAAANPDFWNRASSLLDTRNANLEEAKLTRAMQTPSSCGRMSELERTHLLNWLAPSEREGALGRLSKYDIIDVIGEGGMGVVLKAFDPALERFVAIKTLRPLLASSLNARRRFTREAKSAAALRHDNVLAIYAVDEWDSVPYFVMPLVTDGTLAERASRRRLDLDSILHVATQIASGLAAAHARGLVHRDIKPSNIMLVDKQLHVVIADFGLARAVDDDSMTRTGFVAGTPQFMSPEQARGVAVDARSDLFSLGSLMYWMAAGRSPFASDNSFAILTRIAEDEPLPPSQVDVTLPKWFDKLILSLLAKAPEDRIESAERLMQILVDCRAHLRDSHNKLPLEILRSSRRKPAVIAACVSLLAFFVLGVWSVFGSGSGDSKLQLASGTADTPTRAEPDSASNTSTGSNVQAQPFETPSNIPSGNQESSSQKVVSPSKRETAPQEQNNASPPRSNNPPRSYNPPRTQMGPLDDLDQLVAIDELKNKQQVEYWLQRLASLSISQRPEAVLRFVEAYNSDPSPAIRQLALKLLDPNPFEEVANPFEATEP